jgi:hypothetical protein
MRVAPRGGGRGGDMAIRQLGICPDKCVRLCYEGAID